MSLSHNGVTQNDSDDVPKTPKLQCRNGVYYFRARYPTSIVRGLAMKKKEFQRSLRTRDRKKAQAQWARVTLEFQLEVERLENELQGKESKKSTGFSYETLTDSQRRDIIFRWFISREKSLALYREEISSNAEPTEKAERLQDERATYASLADCEEVSSADWENKARQILESQGIDTDGASLGSFAILLKEAELELVRRSLEMFERQDHSLKANSLFSDLHAFSSAPPRLKVQHTIDDLCLKYQMDKKKTGVSAGTLATYSMQFRILRDFFGASSPLSSIAVEQAQALADFLGQIPINATKIYPNTSLKEAAILEEKKDSPRLISPKTQRDHLQGISAMFRHAKELDWISSNPVKKRAVSNRLPEVKEKDAVVFSPEELTKLFSLPDFLNNRHHPKYYPRFWIPLLCFFHGMRANEAAQLLVEDIKEEKGIRFLDIRKTNDAGEVVKQLKTSQSIRRIPFSDQFLETGFIAFVEEQKKTNETWLFPTLGKTNRGSMADSVSKWFSRLRKTVTIGDSLENRDKTLHSFRHSFTRAGRDAGIETRIMEALGGWVESSSKRSSESSYGNGYDLQVLKKAIEKLQLLPFGLAPLLRREKM